MKTIRFTLTLLLAALWLPVTSHCLLIESFGEIEFLSCCAHETTSSTADHHEEDCARDTCALVEGAQYKYSGQRLTAPPLNWQIAFELPPPATGIATAKFLSSRLNAPPQVHRGSWQIYARTALPVRAPSFAS